jgi:glc operon protein GlcG
MSLKPARTRLVLLLAVTVATTMLTQTSAVAQPPVPYAAPISVESARRAALAAIAEGKKHDWPIAVAVVDTGGALVYFERIDGTQTGSIDLAIEKARTSVAFKRSTKALEDRVVAGRLQYLRQTGAIPIEGGLLLLEQGKIVGAIGVSGVRSEQDGACAQAGVDAVVPPTVKPE